jgi:polar amino acid transport system substrate-binding protein
MKRLSKMKKLCTLLLAVVLMFSLVGCSGGTTGTEAQANSTIDNILERGTLIVGTAPGYLPFEMKDVDGNFIGYDIDMGNAIAESLGVEVEFRQFDFSALIPALQTGDIDIIISGMTIRGDRAAAVSFSNPYFETGQVLMVPSSDTTTESWEDLDIEGNIMAASQGTTGALLAKRVFQNATVSDYADFPTSGLAIMQGKAQGIIYDEPPIRMFEAMHKGEVRGIYDLVSVENLGFAVQINDLETVQWLNSFLEGYRNGPSDLASQFKWFDSTDWMEIMAE